MKSYLLVPIRDPNSDSALNLAAVIEVKRNGEVVNEIDVVVVNVRFHRQIPTALRIISEGLQNGELKAETPETYSYVRHLEDMLNDYYCWAYFENEMVAMVAKYLKAPWINQRYLFYFQESKI